MKSHFVPLKSFELFLAYKVCNNTETCKQNSEGQSQLILSPKSNIIKTESLEKLISQITIQNFGGFNYTHSGYFMRHRMHDLKTTKL